MRPTYIPAAHAYRNLLTLTHHSSPDSACPTCDRSLFGPELKLCAQARRVTDARPMSLFHFVRPPSRSDLRQCIPARLARPRLSAAGQAVFASCLHCRVQARTGGVRKRFLRQLEVEGHGDARAIAARWRSSSLRPILPRKFPKELLQPPQRIWCGTR